MSAQSRFSDSQLKDYLELFKDDPAKVSKIAKLLKVSIPAVSKRIAKLEAAAAPKMSVAAERAVESVFNVSANLENVHADLNMLIAECTSVNEKSVVYGKILDTLKLAKGCLETLYAVQEIHGFMEEVLSILESFEPGTRERVLQALQQRRTVRAAFIQRPTHFGN